MKEFLENHQFTKKTNNILRKSGFSQDLINKYKGNQSMLSFMLMHVLLHNVISTKNFLVRFRKTSEQKAKLDSSLEFLSEPERHRH
ncbi:hypothetical protein A2767_06320 [Candidatus Roizmanbacteria bacterium RIFCSPHIGHO2_01_FULL_35_10]|uniref:Uncharacterized protein n=1 Tax=Candidatus Roizmanbacteria bacterium RIFCSPLOWO2_01_FULL_35_13 TaxID=1802055 RepID=A0A1F7IHP8_9BACT|nr:MAG: hypothetical protein A2767_06320 [Candidatus Roizmanbacteria bacterium RIFCSPHIGHO2_01_FULL_35_10]OGK42845.1 MAG: hypothetical protein A3A74_01405 [Candidatus Roizmanbacteria bacterium RIFCSPLOWO2_01_FULL_35_13]